MSSRAPDRSDAVLGGQNSPPRDAVVLGGLAGAEQKLAHELRSRHQSIATEGWKLPAPIDPVRERGRLQLIAKGLSNRQIECQFTEPSPYLLSRLTARGRSDFDRDLSLLRMGQIVRNFPWDKTGRVALKTAVVLNIYEKTPDPNPHSKERDLCLAAIGPDRRSDEQIVKIGLTDLYAIDRNHRWENCPWLWTDKDTPHTELLGTNQHIATPENDRAMRSLSLLNEGKIEEALGLYGVILSTVLHQILGGGIVKNYYSDLTWRDLLVDTLRQSAPWKLPQAVIDEAARIDLWASQKKSRKPRLPLLKLALFPNQRYTHKTCLMLTENINDRHPQLIMQSSAINDRLHHTAWKRSISVDFARYGITIETD
ncbi:hypothetical protein [Chamaesiphon polymorphus]|uniref:Uncharacterized protein n=1 Tax=Chamaesiphon polymorphus CCALA 037 TaxID=2107692 RepID=A0A2T1G3Z6_9CYAN|nr:hypothetical protein [Chamaesiphon polymorphus]PSB51962.1 hypothetical protein C7B77_20985 [Chamaesiphon polymorphus CCALA 037]